MVRRILESKATGMVMFENLNPHSGWFGNRVVILTGPGMEWQMDDLKQAVLNYNNTEQRAEPVSFAHINRDSFIKEYGRVTGRSDGGGEPTSDPHGIFDDVV